MSNIQTPCLLFDEQCPLCKRFAQSLERLEFKNKLYFYSIYNEDIYKELNFLNREEVHEEVHLVLGRDAGTVLRGAQVVQFLAAENPQVNKFAWLIESDVGQKAMEVFYKGLNKCRKSLHARCPKCKTKKARNINL